MGKKNDALGFPDINDILRQISNHIEKDLMSGTVQSDEGEDVQLHVKTCNVLFLK